MNTPTNWPRCIAHLDLDAFYATVEEVMNPDIAGLPVIVVMGDDTSTRGAVATASYAARKLGVHSAMPVSQARRLCPDGVYLSVRHALYREFSKKVMDLLLTATPLLEQVSIDEAYLDLTEFADPGATMAELQGRIKSDIGLSASVGLATNKLTAKMASGRLKPGGLTIVEPGQEATFLAPLAVGKLHGVGPKSAARLEEIGISTIGDLAAAELGVLRETFGPNLGAELHRHAAGIDDRPIVTQREAKSLSNERTFFEDTTNRRELWRYIQEMAVSLEESMKKRDLMARTVAIKLRFNDFRTITRAETLPVPTAEANLIAASAARLMRRTWQNQPLRLLGVRVSNFVQTDAPRQLELLQN